MGEKKSRSVQAIRAFKTLAFGVGGFLVGVGCCGIDAHLHPNAEFGGGSFAGVGTVAMAVSGLVIVVAVIWLLVLGIMSLGSKQDAVHKDRSESVLIADRTCCSGATLGTRDGGLQWLS